MILNIKDNPRSTDSRVTFRLQYEGDDVNLFLKKDDHVEQVVLKFKANGEVRTVGTYTDIGFERDRENGGHLVIRKG